MACGVEFISNNSLIKTLLRNTNVVSYTLGTVCQGCLCLRVKNKKCEPKLNKMTQISILERFLKDNVTQKKGVMAAI